MATVVDFHSHIFPDRFGKWAFKDRLNGFRKQARSWAKPLSGSLHGLQTSMRYLPTFVRKNVDQVSGLLPLAGLAVESTPADLVEAMDEAGVHFALVIAHPPFASNDFILEACRAHPQFIPVVNIPKGTAKPGSVLKSFSAKGAKVLKIHAAFDGEGVDSPRYRSLLRAASDLNMPVIIHTGCIHSHLFFRDPAQGSPENFIKWYETYPHLKFILAHMNYHHPQLALDLCEEYDNLMVDTSWQPTEVIGESVRRIGAERILFGTDWPLVGGNIAVGRKRIQECVDTGLLNRDQATLILGENALKLLGLNGNAD